MPQDKKKPIIVNDKNDPRLKTYNDSLSLFNGVQGDINRLKELEKTYKDKTTVGNLWYDYSEKSKKTPKYLKGLQAYKDLQKLNGKYPEPVLKYESSPGNSAEEYKKPVQPVILEDKPKLEAIKPIGYKPINTFIQPKLAGNIIVPEIPKSNTVVQNYTAGKQLEKMKKPTGYINSGDKSGIQEFKNGGKLNPLEENAFQKEYKLYSQKTGNSPNPDDPEHYYDYRRLFKETGSIMNHLSNDNHLPSEYKTLGHPNLYIKGRNTKTFQQGGQLGSTLGSVAGMAIGSIIAPGVGTSIGGMLGGMLGSKAGNFVSNQFMNGGPLLQVPENNKLVDIKGNPHSKGGVTLADGGNNEVQGNETIIKYIDDNGKKQSYVASADIMYNKKQTIADKSRAIEKKYFRDNKIDAMGKSFENKKLIAFNEKAKNDMNYNSFMNGGKLKKKYVWGGGISPNHPMSDDRATSLLMNDLKFTPSNVTDEGFVNLDGSTEPILSSPTVSKDSGLSTPTFNNNNAINPSITSNITNNPTSVNSNVFSNKPNYGNILPQLAGDAFNIAQGLKGGDEVNFQRVTPYLANPRPAITAMNNATSTSFNNARNAIRNSATSSGEYLAQMNSLAGAESLKRGVGIAGIKAEYDRMNTGIMNQTSSQNAGIQMNEADARQRETDAARSAVSKGLSDMGSKIGSINNEKNARINQKDLVSLMSKNGYKLTRDANGELGFEKNGTYVPYEIAIDSVFQPQTKG